MKNVRKIKEWLIEPSAKITEPDHRRQAALLSTLLLGIILVAVVVEALTIAFTVQADYRGYWATIVAVVLVAVIYFISRSEHVQLAATLAVSAISFGALLAGWNDPVGVQKGLFDFMIIPIWFGSLFLSTPRLIWLIVADLAAILITPFFVPAIPLQFIIVGPFSFLLILSFLLIVMTRHRNLMEHDRQRQLAAKEANSRREAARARALLRVAQRLNAQLNVETLLQAICEEVTQALNTPVSFIALYDPRQLAFFSAAAVGIGPDLLKGMQPYPKILYNDTVATFGTCFGLPDLREYPQLPNQDVLRQLDLRSLAFATMKYEQELIGSLTAITTGEMRIFSEDELLLLQGLADQAALAIINTRLFKDARRRLEHLQALRAIDLAITSNHDLRQTLDLLLEQITSQLAVDAAVILLMDEARQQLEYAASRGFRTQTLRFTRLRLNEGMAGRAAGQRKIVNIQNLQAAPQTLVYAPLLLEEGFISYYAAPLISQGKVNGVLEIFHRAALHPDAEWLGFLEALAGQAAIAIGNTTLLDDLQRSNNELSAAYQSTIEGWSRALDLRDKETEGHTQRVTELTLELSRAFGFSDAELVHIERGALLHDIGKMGVPDRILLKEGKLSDEEWDVMQQHPGLAHEMLLPISYLRPALDIPYCHHEKWDGTGYPRRLKGHEIPLTARIFAVVDVWDALTSHRPYRAAWTQEKALAHIVENAGSHFDPYVVDVFKDLIGKRMGQGSQPAD